MFHFGCALLFCFSTSSCIYMFSFLSSVCFFSQFSIQKPFLSMCIARRQCENAIITILNWKIIVISFGSRRCRFFFIACSNCVGCFFLLFRFKQQQQPKQRSTIFSFDTCKLCYLAVVCAKQQNLSEFSHNNQFNVYGVQGSRYA